nr:zinc finger, CCHC-type, retrotransposon Gag domain protein [Tanacetum cinerariifolium]
MIDMAESVRLQICEELDDTWAWVALGPERQQVAASGALEVTEGALDVDEGNQDVSTPIQAPQPPVAGPARTMAHRLGRLDEDVHGLCRELGEKIEVLDNMARDFSRFTIWTVTGFSRMMDQAEVRTSLEKKSTKLVKYRSSGILPALQLMAPGTISLGLVQNPPSPTPYVPQNKKDCDILFQPMFDEYFNPPPSVASPVSVVVAPKPTDPTGTSSSTFIDQDALSPTHLDNDPFFGVLIPKLNSRESSSREVIPTNERLKREYHSIHQTSTETSTEFMQHFLRLAGFLGAAAGTEEEQAKNFQWGL